MGKRRLRTDPSEEANFYEICENKYSIPDYYDRKSSGRPLLFTSTVVRLIPNMNKINCELQQEDRSWCQEVSNFKVNCRNLSSTSSLCNLIEYPKIEPCDSLSDCKDRVLHDHRAFSQMHICSVLHQCPNTC